MLYRAQSEQEILREPHISTSVIAVAEAKDGVHFENRRILFGPSTEYDKYGCEDPRITKIGKTYYIFYTALGGFPFSADNIKVAVALSKDLKTIDEKHLVTPFNAKAMALFPEKINGKMAALVTINTDRVPSDICYIEFDKPEDMWSSTYWNEWMKALDGFKIPLHRSGSDQVELGAPPVKTDKGWLVIYSRVQNYGKPDSVFGVEAVLLDSKDPKRIIAITKGPFMVPDEYYEKVGHVSNIVFPSGALIRKDKLEIYYGAADTHCAIASVYLDDLLDSMTNAKRSAFKRYAGNPIISPRPGLAWEAGGTLNPAAIYLGDKVHIIYRGASATNVSALGYAVSDDGFAISERPKKPIYLPRADFERRSDSTNANYGCEDPRIVQVGDKLYMTYTAYDGKMPRVAVSSISVKDFLAMRWKAWSVPNVITPPTVSNKDAAILPEKIGGKYMILHRVNNDVCADMVSSLDFSKESITRCIEIISPRQGMWDSEKVGIAGPPVKTKQGWLLLYHGISRSRKYRVGALLLDLNDPTVVKARTAAPVFEPEEEYELKGTMPNVVFPCSLVVIKGVAYIYYGAADSVIGAAAINLNVLLRKLRT